MGKEKNKLLDKKLDNVSLEQVSGGSGTSNESTQCPLCKKSHQFKSLGSARVSYNLKWTDATKYSCDNVDPAISVFYKVVAPGGTVWLDVNFDVIG